MNGEKHYFTINNFAFTERTNDHGYKTRERITGFLINTSRKEYDKYSVLRLHLIDATDFYLISIYENSDAAHSLHMIIRNVDVRLPVQFGIEKRDDKANIYAIQGGKVLPSFYTRDSIKDLPVNVDDRPDFCRKIFLTEIKDRCARLMNPYPNHPVYKKTDNGLQGGYFDAQKNNVRVVGPISREERKNYRDDGTKWR